MWLPDPLLPSTAELESEFDRLWPIMRSVTGAGVRETLGMLSEIVPIDSISLPSGSQVFDWTVPPEWRFREAYLIDPNGNRILDAGRNTLHLINGSVPFRGRMSLAELQPHLHSIPDRPGAIPYVTSYYSPRWGFCLSQEMRDALPEGEYEVVVDTALDPQGRIDLGEIVLPGEEETEILFSSYVCHPSLANNELSGPLVAIYLARALAALPKRRLTYRFAFLVETIGAITYLSQRGAHLKRHLAAGYVVTCTGTPTPFVYKPSRDGATLADRTAMHVLSAHQGGGPVKVLAFNPADGSDERQYCSPGFDLPVGSVMRSPYNTYPQYHTSEDDKSFITFDALRESVAVYYDLARAFEANRTWRNTVMFCEPQLGKRGLYGNLGGLYGPDAGQAALLWLLNQADGTRDLLAISERSGIDLKLLASVARDAEKAGLIQAV